MGNISADLGQNGSPLLAFGGVIALTAIDIPSHIDTSSIKGDETKREKHAHAESGIVRGARKLRDHGSLQAQRNHAT